MSENRPEQPGGMDETSKAIGDAAESKSATGAGFKAARENAGKAGETVAGEAGADAAQAGVAAGQTATGVASGDVATTTAGAANFAQTTTGKVVAGVSQVASILLNPATWIIGAVLIVIMGLLVVGISTNQVFGPNPYACQDIEDCEPAEPVCEVIQTGSVGGPISPTFSLGGDAKTRRVGLMRELITRLSLTPEQAAGILGNLMQESTASIEPDINQGGAQGPPTGSYVSGNAYGWAQWDADRKKRLVEYAVSQKYVASANVPFNDAANLAYLIYELENFEKSSIPALKKTTTARDAARSWREVFERSASMEPARYTNAEQALQEYKTSGSATTPTGTGTGSWVAPVKTPFTITAHFPSYPSGGNHTGVDFDGVKGDPVYAVGGGTARPAGNSWAGPNAVMIDHGNGYWTFYAHMNSKLITQETPVSAGQQIGTIGALGNVTSSSGDGSHLHLELGKNGSSPGSSGTLDPEDYLTFFPGANKEIPAPVGGAGAIGEGLCGGTEEGGVLGGSCAGTPTPYSGPLPSSMTITPQMAHTKVQVETNCGEALSGPLGNACNRDTVNRTSSSGHYHGVACDIFPKGSASGKNNCANQTSEGCVNGFKIANWLIANGEALKVKYVIWDAKIWQGSNGWKQEPYDGCGPTVCNGSATALHQDHVHVSMQPGP